MYIYLKNTFSLPIISNFHIMAHVNNHFDIEILRLYDICIIVRYNIYVYYNNITVIYSNITIIYIYITFIFLCMSCW